MAKRPPAKAKRDLNEPAIVEVFEAHGISVYSLDMPADLLLGYGRRTWLVEVKNGRKATFTPPQIKFRAGWNGNYDVVTCIEDAESLAKSIRRGEQ